MADVHLTLRHERWAFRATGQGRLPEFAGSAWRGAFGHALKRTVCVMRLRPCAGCPLERSCIYPTLFEAAPDAEGERLTALTRVAQPYVLMPPPQGPRQVGPGDRLELGVTLVGHAIQQRAYVSRALETAAAIGIGGDRVGLEVATCQAVPAEAALPECDMIRLHLRTPLRLKVDGRLVTPASFRPRDLLMALLRRVSMLRAFHDGVPLALDFMALKQAAEKLAWQRCAVRWQDTARYSTQQQAKLRMGGLVGEATLDAAGAAPFRPFLALAPWIGVGKGASMGLGQVAVTAV